jgi:hypothetical protein
MSPTSHLFKPRLRVLVTLGLTVVFCPHSTNQASGTPAPVTPPSYWVASLAVDPKYYVKDEFRPDLHDFFMDVHNQTSGRSIWGQMNPEGCYASNGRKPNCEVVDVVWNQKNHDLTLRIEESDDREGSIVQYTCTDNDTFVVCFEHHMKSMAAKVHEHDNACHIQGRKCEINKNHEFEPLPQ